MSKHDIIRNYCKQNNIETNIRNILINLSSFRNAKTREAKLAFIDICLELTTELVTTYKEPLINRLYNALFRKKNKHYAKLPCQPITLMKELDFNINAFFACNVIKYLSRYKYKDGLKDIKKAEHYLILIKKELKKVEKNLDF